MLSGLFPYFATKKELELYLPKPILNLSRQKTLTGYKETKILATQLKKVKKMAYVRTILLSAGDTNKANFKALDTEEGRSFGRMLVTEKVNKRRDQSEPYFVGGYQFVPDAGLYMIVGFESDEQKLFFDQLVELIGLTGIGGERSSGYGKFELLQEAIEVTNDKKQDKDIKALARLLGKPKARMYMAISAIAPQADELSIVKNGFYQLIKRSGFVTSPVAQQAVKRNSCYLLAEGSCFSEPLQGRILTMKAEGVAHDIYRNGLGVFVGVDYD